MDWNAFIRNTNRRIDGIVSDRKAQQEQLRKDTAHNTSLQRDYDMFNAKKKREAAIANARITTSADLQKQKIEAATKQQELNIQRNKNRMDLFANIIKANGGGDGLGGAGSTGNGAGGGLNVEQMTALADNFMRGGIGNVPGLTLNPSLATDGNTGGGKINGMDESEFMRKWENTFPSPNKMGRPMTQGLTPEEIKQRQAQSARILSGQENFPMRSMFSPGSVPKAISPGTTMPTRAGFNDPKSNPAPSIGKVVRYKVNQEPTKESIKRKRNTFGPGGAQTEIARPFSFRSPFYRQ